MNADRSSGPALAAGAATHDANRASHLLGAFHGRGLPPGWLLVAAALAACWLLLFDQLRSEWQVNPQYNFGWLVPLLSASLFQRRWGVRPAACPATGGGLMRGVSLLLLGGMLPLRILQEANPEWRLLYWVQGFDVLGLSLAVLHAIGGWRWVRFFAPPIVFMLIAIPWPMEVETGVIQGLMRFVAMLTTDAVGFLGIPALQRGNLIEVASGIVGIDEACSGVNSLQSALMVSLFLGEQHRFGWRGRLGLLSGSVGFVLLANTARTTFLVWAAATRGIETMERWHDTVGMCVMVGVLGMMFALAWALKPKAADRTTPRADRRFPPVAPIPRYIGVASLGWVLLVLAGTEAWYRLHEGALVPSPAWSFAWPTGDPEFKRLPIAEASLAMLRCTKTESASWMSAEGDQWRAAVLRWEPGRNSAQLAKGHRPDICFPAMGARLGEDYGTVTVDVGGLRLPLHHQMFESGSRSLHVFYCLWPDKVSPRSEGLLEDGSRGSRFRAAWAGNRHVGQTVLEVVVQGPESGAAAASLIHTLLPGWIKPG